MGPIHPISLCLITYFSSNPCLTSQVRANIHVHKNDISGAWLNIGLFLVLQSSNYVRGYLRLPLQLSILSLGRYNGPNVPIFTTALQCHSWGLHLTYHAYLTAGNTLQYTSKLLRPQTATIKLILNLQVKLYMKP